MQDKRYLFKQDEYWKSRVSGKIGLETVGHRSLGRAYNEYLYRRRLEIVHALAAQLKRPADLRILDIGCGSGFYVDYWHNLGVKDLVGVDISDDGIAMMRKKYPQFSFHAKDATDASAFSMLEGKFDVITLFDVVYHIIDDEAVDRLFQNISQVLSDDGVLLIFDHICKKRYSLVKHVVYRGENAYHAWLNSAGLVLHNRLPLFVLLSPPILGVKALDYLVAGMYKIAGMFYRLHDKIGRLFGFLFYKLDQIARTIHLQTPNLEVLLVRKKS
jgi:SAM-dependent methyltransferase